MKSIAVTAASLFLALSISGCNQFQKQSEASQRVSNAPSESPHAPERRFMFPEREGSFPAASVALDTETGQLCKTYRWNDTQAAPRGLPLCSELTGAGLASANGATKSYLGYSYRFNGLKWVKGSESLKYNDKTGNMEPLSEDQYDPLNLFSREDKSKHLLSGAEIQRVADQFGASYEDAWKDAKAQGYQVPTQKR